jgi:hypothetical protein
MLTPAERAVANNILDKVPKMVGDSRWRNKLKRVVAEYEIAVERKELWQQRFKKTVAEDEE